MLLTPQRLEHKTRERGERKAGAREAGRQGEEGRCNGRAVLFMGESINVSYGAAGDARRLSITLALLST